MTNVNLAPIITLALIAASQADSEKVDADSPLAPDMPDDPDAGRASVVGIDRPLPFVAARTVGTFDVTTTAYGAELLRKPSDPCGAQTPEQAERAKRLAEERRQRRSTRVK